MGKEKYHIYDKIGPHKILLLFKYKYPIAVTAIITTKLKIIYFFIFPLLNYNICYFI